MEQTSGERNSIQQWIESKKSEGWWLESAALGHFHVNPAGYKMPFGLYDTPDKAWRALYLIEFPSLFEQWKSHMGSLGWSVRPGLSGFLLVNTNLDDPLPRRMFVHGSELHAWLSLFNDTDGRITF